MKPVARKIADDAGLTLVEVVAALVLLSILGGTVLPVLITARRATATELPTVSRDALAKFADDWLASKEGSKLVAGTPIDFERDWKSNPGGATVRIRSVGPGSDATGHVWLTFESSGTTVVRCADVEAAPTAEAK